MVVSESWLSVLDGASVQPHYEELAIWLTTDWPNQINWCKILVWFHLYKARLNDILLSLISDIWNFSCYLESFIPTTAGGSQPLTCFSLFSQYSLSVNFSPWNDTDEEIWCKILAGCCCISAGMRRGSCHVYFKTLKSWFQLFSRYSCQESYQ